MANETDALSSDGRTSLIQREGLVRYYYNDTVNNCTYGVGTLAHLGPCTGQELHTHLTDDQLGAGLQHGIDRAESVVRQNVTQQNLTQPQFDALVSFVYNVGSRGAHQVLRQVNAGHLDGAAQEMSLHVHATVRGPDRRPLRDAHGRVIKRILHGLVRRRAEETGPFRAQQAPRGDIAAPTAE